MVNNHNGQQSQRSTTTMVNNGQQSQRSTTTSLDVRCTLETGRTNKKTLTDGIRNPTNVATPFVVSTTSLSNATVDTVEASLPSWVPFKKW
jgi:hypothetical protein